MTMISDIRTGLLNMLKTIKVANGYKHDLVDANIHPFFDKGIFAVKTDATLYPKVFLMLDAGTIEGLPSRRSQRELGFLLTEFIIKGAAETDVALLARIEEMMEDVDRAIDINHDLGGIANEVILESFSNDSGILTPEAGAGMRILVRYQVQR